MAFARSLLDDPIPGRRTFARRLTLHGTRRRAEFVSLGPAHTGDDAVLVLPDDGVVFCGDLLFVACHPYLPDGDPERWRDALDVLLGFGAARYVPGHGPVGGPDSVEDLLPDDASLDWAYAFPFYRANLRFLLERLEARART